MPPGYCGGIHRRLRIELKYGDLKQRVMAVVNFFKELH